MMSMEGAAVQKCSWETTLSMRDKISRNSEHRKSQYFYVHIDQRETIDLKNLSSTSQKQFAKLPHKNLRFKSQVFSRDFSFIGGKTPDMKI
jgi:hypothetical protein